MRCVGAARDRKIGLPVRCGSMKSWPLRRRRDLLNRVSFEPGARTAWHTHPRGQALHVLTGVGRVQLAGKPAQIITAGDSVWIEAGERHWHGADASHTMVHLAIQEADQSGVSVVWLEHVSEQDYSAPVEQS